MRHIGDQYSIYYVGKFSGVCCVYILREAGRKLMDEKGVGSKDSMWRKAKKCHISTEKNALFGIVIGYIASIKHVPLFKIYFIVGGRYKNKVKAKTERKISKLDYQLLKCSIRHIYHLKPLYTRFARNILGYDALNSEQLKTAQNIWPPPRMHCKAHPRRLTSMRPPLTQPLCRCVYGCNVKRH